MKNIHVTWSQKQDALTRAESCENIVEPLTKRGVERNALLRPVVCFLLELSAYFHDFGVIREFFLLPQWSLVRFASAQLTLGSSSLGVHSDSEQRSRWVLPQGTDCHTDKTEVYFSHACVCLDPFPAPGFGYSPKPDKSNEYLIGHRQHLRVGRAL